MRALLCFALFVSICMTSELFGQEERGTWILGGSVSYRQTESLPDVLSVLGVPTYTEGYKQTITTLLPRVGFFVSPNAAVGLSVGYKKTTYVLEDGDDEYGEKQTIVFQRVVVGPYGRIYKRLGEKTTLFVDGSLLIEKGTDRQKYEEYNDPDDYSNDKVRISAWGILIQPGFSYHVTSRFAMEIRIGRLEYASLDAKGARSVSINNTSFAAEFNLKKASLGIEWYLQ